MEPFIQEDIERLRMDLKHLGERKFGYAVSLYAPMHRAGADTRENSIRFKNRVQEAEQLLESHDMEPRNIDKLLGDAKALIEDNQFWQHQADGFAMLLTEEHTHSYRLQKTFEPMTLVNDHFYLKPLLPLLTGDGTYYVLAASLNKARFFEATRGGINELELPEDTPLSMDYATRFDDPEKSTHEQTISGSRPGGARPDVTAHGTGAGDLNKKDLILRYFKLLENGVTDILADKSAPLMFVGVDYEFPLYKEANHYHHLMDEHVDGNPDEWGASDIHEKTWEKIKDHFEEERRTALASYNDVAHTDKGSDILDDIVPAALDARIDTLFVSEDKHIWGSYEREERKLELSEGDARSIGSEDMLDLAAVQTLMNGGKVYTLPSENLPGGKDAVAIYRF